VNKSPPKRSLESATLAGDELISTPIGDIELRHSYFDDDASRRLFDEMDYQRAPARPTSGVIRSSFCGSTGRPNRLSRRPGNPAT
jgi:hypothetical protein